MTFLKGYPEQAQNTDPLPEPTKFKVGSIYSTGEGSDYVWRFKVVSRTAKFITIVDVKEPVRTIRKGVTVGYGGHEFALPLCTYSMAPVITADAPYVTGRS